MPRFMDPAERVHRAGSFAGVAQEYDRGRPGYPAEAINWILGSRPLEVLDLGAGTGKLTDAVLAAGHDVTAVEPLAEMREVLAARHPDLPVVEGAAEQLPLADGAVDAVVVGAAFHWFEQDAALGEIARVLRPGGVLGLLGNSFDTLRSWAAELRGILGQATLGRAGHWPEPETLAGIFAAVDDADFPHAQEMTLEQLRDYASSRSSFAVLGEAARSERLREIDRLWERAPELAGRSHAQLHWITRVRRCGGLV
jgi:ubiquinone/menaquinone biosynthesis C-methylase UbiE